MVEAIGAHLVGDVERGAAVLDGVCVEGLPPVIAEAVLRFRWHLLVFSGRAEDAARLGPAGARRGRHTERAAVPARRPLAGRRPDRVRRAGARRADRARGPDTERGLGERAGLVQLRRVHGDGVGVVGRPGGRRPGRCSSSGRSASTSTTAATAGRSPSSPPSTPSSPTTTTGPLDTSLVRRAVPADRPVHRRVPAPVPRRPLRLLDGGPLVVGRAPARSGPGPPPGGRPRPARRPRRVVHGRDARCRHRPRCSPRCRSRGRSSSPSGPTPPATTAAGGSPSGWSTGSAPSPTTSCAGWPTRPTPARRPGRPAGCSGWSRCRRGRPPGSRCSGRRDSLVDGDGGRATRAAPGPGPRAARRADDPPDARAGTGDGPPLARPRAGRRRPQPAGHVDPPPAVPRTGPRAR